MWILKHEGDNEISFNLLPRKEYQIGRKGKALKILKLKVNSELYLKFCFRLKSYDVYFCWEFIRFFDLIDGIYQINSV